MSRSLDSVFISIMCQHGIDNICFVSTHGHQHMSCVTKQNFVLTHNICRDCVDICRHMSPVISYSINVLIKKITSTHSHCVNTWLSTYVMYREVSEVDTKTTYVVCRHIVVNICQDVCCRQHMFCVNTWSSTYVMCNKANTLC